KRLLAEQPWLQTPYYGLVELQMAVPPMLVRAFEKRAGTHPVPAHLPGFLEHVRSRVFGQGVGLGIARAEEPGAAGGGHGRAERGRSLGSARDVRLGPREAA